jgi:hypothetical protein
LSQQAWLNLAGSINSPPLWTSGVNTLLQQYWASDVALCDGYNIFPLDQGWFNYIQAIPSLSSDGAHLTDLGYQAYWGRIGAIFQSTLTASSATFVNNNSGIFARQ